MAFAAVLGWPAQASADLDDDIDAALRACAAIRNDGIRSSCLDALLREFGYWTEDAISADGPGTTAAAPGDAAGSTGSLPRPSAGEDSAADGALVPEVPLIEDAVIPTGNAPPPAGPLPGASAQEPPVTQQNLPAPQPPVAGPEFIPDRRSQEQPSGSPVRVIELRASPAQRIGAVPTTAGPDAPASDSPAPTRNPVPRPETGDTGVPTIEAPAPEEGARPADASPFAAVPVPAPRRPGEGVASAGMTRWRVTGGPSDASGRDLFLHTVAETSTGDGSDGRVEPVLWVACRGSRTSVYIDWERSLGGSAADLSITLDGAAEEAVRLPVGVDRQSVGWWRDKEAKARIRALFGTSKMHVRLTAPSAPSAPRLGATFDVSGLQAQIRLLREACGW